MTIPAAGEALKRLLGRQEASTSMVHLDYLNNQHKKTHLIEWMWEDNEHNKINGVVKQCQMMSPGSQLDPYHSVGLLGLCCLLQVTCSVPCLCSNFPHYSAAFSKSRFSSFFPLGWKGTASEWALILAVWMAYRCNFSKHTSQILLVPSKTPRGTLA